ncbi:hypothetical protein KGD83_22495 [Nocardiopsis akebiae]|uniref:Uncharacterized protein n=1 Tax=Nocardiopsis akebiae TaxID=2831968 RepID=A0ABX8C620_9ACTN|nr:hypothetical protein [Nocardiopsis akebiae]QUX28013.1 hypothetical protein KGD83_22495 [Nocardiopsis akebiae]
MRGGALRGGPVPAAGGPSAPLVLAALAAACTAYLAYALLWEPPQPPPAGHRGELIAPPVNDAPVATAPVLDPEAEVEELEAPVADLDPPVAEEGRDDTPDAGRRRRGPGQAGTG